MSTRLIAVDDTSPLISYHGPWTKEIGVSDTYFPYGDYAPFNNTLHSLTGSGSFTFMFTGTSVFVIGSSNNTLPPSSWTCYINGNRDTSPSNNNVEICSLSNIVDNNTTPVNLTVQALGTSQMPFLLDYIQYAPIGSIPDNATVLVDAFDTQIKYRDASGGNDSGWVVSGDQVETTLQGASMIFDFVGTQITWIAGSLPADSSTGSSSASYTIDNGTFFPFTVSFPSSGSDPWAYFQTPSLSPGSHLLTVAYNLSGPTPLPLTLDYFIVQNFASPPPSPTPTPPTNDHRLSGGAIAGIVIGTLLGLALVVFIVYWIIWSITKPEDASEPEPVSQMAYQDGRSQG